ncbi:DUF1493 family protein [Pantoea sp. 1.19]|uniref:DUF1493 family protein n=1 Tax=Pantoea sp. 1.19 TaxID=1925589 RepID=UPI000948C9F9|nr:DUF1493 family protein [Pantoea sp. 1.19]
MSEITDDIVRDFVLRELPLVTTLFLKKVPVGDDVALQEIHEADDVAEMAEKYFRYFQVKSDGFSVDNYYPWRVKSIFSCKMVMQKKPPLTIHMFIESARAGCWLYK